MSKFGTNNFYKTLELKFIILDELFTFDSIKAFFTIITNRICL